MKNNSFTRCARNVVAVATVLVVAAAMQGCSSSAPAKNAGAESQLVWPKPDAAWLAGGAFPNIENLRKVGLGMTKDQLYGLLDKPHFDEGPFGAKVWNYLFNFRTGKGDEYVTCQYQVSFKDGLSSALNWKDNACARFLAVETKRAEVPAERFRLSADALFGFDRSSAADMLPEGRRQLDALATELASRKQQVGQILVIGHADRLGPDERNQALSFARADTVRAFLVSRGIAPEQVRASGAGSSRPIVQCAGERGAPGLVECLQPNRRVEIEVSSPAR